MFFLRRPLIIFLGSSSLDVFDLNTKDQVHFDLPKDLFQYGQILDEKRCFETLSDFFFKQSFGSKKVVIVFSSRLVFTGSGDDVDKFLEAVPIERSKAAVIVRRNKSGVLMAAANGNFYKVVMSALGGVGVKVESVVPATAFGTGFLNEKVTMDDVQEMCSEKRIISEFNFLKYQKEKSKNNFQQREGEGKGLNKQYVGLVLSLIIFFCALGYALFSFEIIDNPFVKEKILPTPTVSQGKIMPSLSPTPTSVSLKQSDRDKIGVSVLNGSGVEGQAGEIKDALGKIGYNNVETGNSEDETESETVMMYDETVSSAVREEIVRELKKTFTVVLSRQFPLGKDKVTIITR